MQNKVYLLNLGFFYCTIIPDEKKCYILNGKNFEHTDIQDFVNNKAIDYSKYKSISFPYDPLESWTSYQEAKKPVTYQAKNDLSEDSFIERLVLKKHTDGLLLAIKYPEKDKVKVFKKNMSLLQR